MEKSLYDTDFNLWILHTVEQLKNKQFDQLDLENLIEEVESLGREDKFKLYILLRKLMETLLKLRYWTSDFKRAYRVEALHFRMTIETILKSSPSLKAILEEEFQKAYRDAREILLIDFTKEKEEFPTQPIFTLEEVLDQDWLPIDEDEIRPQ